MRIALIDLSNGASTRDGGVLTPAFLDQLAEAYTIQLNTHFSDEYGGNYQVRRADGPADLQPDENPFAYLGSFADAPGAVAYHSSDGNGRPLLFDALSMSDTLNGPGNSASVAGSHESLEACLDPGCNLYADRADGSGEEHAYEACDAFEVQSYPIAISGGGQIWVSNFALRRFFTPGAVGPYNWMSANGMGAVDAPSPLVTPAGQGYQLIRQADPSSAQAVQGYRYRVDGHSQRRPDAHRWSRKYRRGLR